MLTAARVNTSYFLLDAGYSNGDDANSLPRHRWYSVKEAFSPHLVARAIWEAGCRRGDTIIDPFCGSGTVPLVAATMGFNCVGLEVNPFLAFVAQTKLKQCAPATFEHAGQAVVSSIKGLKRSPLESFSTFSRASTHSHPLFNVPVLRCFEDGWLRACRLREPVKHLMQLCLIAAAMECCNAKRDGKCLRYRAGRTRLRFGKRHFLAALAGRCRMMTEDLFTTRLSGKSSTIHTGDCRKLLAARPLPTFRLCVTSPPYLNSFDYTDIYRPELFLGKFVDSKSALKELRHETVRSHVQVNWRRATGSDYGSTYRRTMQIIGGAAEHLWDARIPLMIQAYFEDIETVLAELRRHAAKRSHVWFVVATSAYAGVEIPVDLIIGEIGCKAGWSLKEVGLLRYLRSSGQHFKRASANGIPQPRLRESVVVFEG